MALIGYLRKGRWRTDAFEHWLIVSLIVGLMGQAVVMSFATQNFDFQFDLAHLLKKVSYVCVLTGLLISMSAIFKQEEIGASELRQALDEIRTLRGVVPICSNCKSVRDDEGFWQRVEVFVRDHTEAEFSRGICPDCAALLYPSVPAVSESDSE